MDARARSERHRLVGAAFFPDFTLRRGDSIVLVEIVGFYTPEYLRSKVAALRSASAHKVIVCIDDSLACADGDVPAKVLRFKRRVDARALLAAAEDLVRPLASCGYDAKSMP